MLDTYFSVNLMERCCELLQESIIDPEIKSRICVSVLGKYFCAKINKNIYQLPLCPARSHVWRVSAGTWSFVITNTGIVSRAANEPSANITRTITEKAPARACLLLVEAAY